MRTVLQIGGFAPGIQAQLDAEFRCVGLADLEREPGLATEVGAIVTRRSSRTPWSRPKTRVSSRCDDASIWSANSRTSSPAAVRR